MINLIDRFIDEYGNVVFKDAGIMELFYSEKDLRQANIVDSTSVDSYNKYIHKFGLNKTPLTAYSTPKTTVQEYHKQRQQVWNIPEPYKSLDLVEWFAERAITQEEQERVALELEMFFERNLEDLLRLLIYLVKEMREKNIVWGVGRGSSIASYCLYLVGVHRIDSIKYELDIKEFLK